MPTTKTEIAGGRQVVTISGNVVNISGQPVGISGQSVVVSGQFINISGQAVVISGQTIVAQFASGVSLLVSISGQPVGISGEAVVISGQFVNISGQLMGRTWQLSGLTDSVAISGQAVVISGQPVQISGQTIVAQFASGVSIPASISGQAVVISGQPVGISGQAIVVSGQFVNISGQLMGRTWQLSGLTDSVRISGQAVVISGQPVQISGQTIVAQFASGVSLPVSVSGQPVQVSGQTIVAQFASGVSIPTSISGQPVLISGQPVSVIISGQVVIISGQFVSISGQPIGISGQMLDRTWALSGLTDSVSISGQTVVVQFASGTALPISISGQPVQVSGQTIITQFASGVTFPVNISGQTVITQFASGVTIATSVSGQPVRISGEVVIISGQFVSISGQAVQVSGQTIISQFASGVSIPTSVSGQPIIVAGPNFTFLSANQSLTVEGSSIKNAVVTSDGALMIANGLTVDIGNSTTTLLGAFGTFIGQVADLTGYSQITVSVSTDVPSAVDGLQILFSNIILFPAIDAKAFTIIGGGYGQTIHVPVNAKFYKIYYANGVIPQSLFRLQTILSPIPSLAIVRNMEMPITSKDDAMVTHSVIAGPIAVGGSSFTDAIVTVDGKFSTLAAISGQVIIISGQFVSISGQTVGISGQAVVISGQPVGISGQVINISGQMSGLPVSVSGQAVVISGQGITIIGQNIVALPADTRFNVVGSSFSELVATSGGALMVANGLETDPNNFTTTALGIGATWNGIMRDLTGYSQISISVTTDVPGTLTITWGTGSATGLVGTKFYSILGLYEETIHIPVNAKFYRIGYTNGAVAQGFFRLQSLLSPIPSVGTIRNIDRPIESQEDSMITHSVIAGPIAVGGSSFIDNVVLPDGQSLVQINQSGQVFGVDGYNKALIQEDVIHRKIHQGTYFYADVSQSTNLSNPASYAITQMSGVNPHLSWHFRGLTPGSLVNVLEVTSARQTTGTVSSNIFLNRTITAFTSTRLYSSYVLGSNVGANSILFETQASGETAYGFGNLYTYPLIPAEWVLKGGFTYVFQILSAQLPSLTTLYANWYESGLA